MLGGNLFFALFLAEDLVELYAALLYWEDGIIFGVFLVIYYCNGDLASSKFLIFGYLILWRLKKNSSGSFGSVYSGSK